MSICHSWIWAFIVRAIIYCCTWKQCRHICHWMPSLWLWPPEEQNGSWWKDEDGTWSAVDEWGQLCPQLWEGCSDCWTSSAGQTWQISPHPFCRYRTPHQLSPASVIPVGKRLLWSVLPQSCSILVRQLSTSLVQVRNPRNRTETKRKNPKWLRNLY